MENKEAVEVDFAIIIFTSTATAAMFLNADDNLSNWAENSLIQTKIMYLFFIEHSAYILQSCRDY